MMPWVRAWLLWVMVVALPVQGMAASLMLFCGSGHERMGQTPAAEARAALPAPGHDQGHGHPAAGLPAHAAQAPADAAAGGGPVDSGARPAADHGDFSCSACAACCAALAPPTSVALPSTPDARLAFARTPLARVRSHHPDGPDRPPRAVPA